MMSSRSPATENYLKPVSREAAAAAGRFLQLLSEDQRKQAHLVVARKECHFFLIDKVRHVRLRPGMGEVFPCQFVRDKLHAIARKNLASVDMVGMIAAVNHVSDGHIESTLQFLFQPHGGFRADRIDHDNPLGCDHEDGTITPGRETVNILANSIDVKLLRHRADRNEHKQKQPDDTHVFLTLPRNGRISESCKKMLDYNFA